MRTILLKIYVKELRQTVILAIPIILAQVGQMLLGVIDAVMVGRLGAVPLAASAFAQSLFSVAFVFAVGISSLISTLVAQADGSQEFKRCGEVLRHGLLINIVVSFLLAFGMHLLTYRLDIFGQTDEVAREARAFMMVTAWSLVPAMIFQGFRQFAEGLSQSFQPMLLMLGGIGLNVLLNWLLIYGNAGFPALGLLGAGIGTLVTRILMAMAMIVYIQESNRFIPYRPDFWFSKWNTEIIFKIFKLGLPSGFQYLFEVGVFAGSAVMMGWMGAITLAAHQVTISMASMTFMVAIGLSVASGVRVGNAVGRDDWKAARRIGFGAMALAAIIQGFCGVLFILGRNYWPSLYIKDVLVQELAAKLLIIAGIFQVFDGIQGVCVGALRGASDVRIPTLITFVSYWLISMPLAYGLAFIFGYGPTGIWTALLVSLVLSATLLSIRFYRVTKWLRQS